MATNHPLSLIHSINALLDYRAELVSMAMEGLHGNVGYYSSNGKW